VTGKVEQRIRYHCWGLYSNWWVC